MSLSMGTACCIVIFDLYEMKLAAPFWVPYVYNILLGVRTGQVALYAYLHVCVCEYVFLSRGFSHIKLV